MPKTTSAQEMITFYHCPWVHTNI